MARHTAAYVEGMQSSGVATSAKHFPGHGDTAIDSHHSVPVIDVDRDVLNSRDLAPFRAALAAGTRAVMSAHILAPALDPENPGTVSRRILTDLLRGEFGYDGLIVTDGMDMQAIAGRYGFERGCVLAIAAGADAICVGGGPSDEGTVLRLRDAFVAAVRSGELSEERLADAADRVRALADWASVSGAAERSGGAPDTGIGLVAARRALTVTRGETCTAPITEAPYVATFTPLPNIAVGDETPWGVTAALEHRLPGTASGSFSGDGAAPRPSRRRGSAASWRSSATRIATTWMAAAVRTLVASRPDTVVVEMGVPQSAPTGALHIATRGAARVCGEAAAEVITGA